MKKLLYIAATCSSFQVFAVVNEQFSLTTLRTNFQQSQEAFQKLQTELAKIQVKLMYDQFALLIREIQDATCSNQLTLEQAKEVLKEQLTPLVNIPNDNSEEAYMLRETLTLVKKALATVAQVTRKNELPAVDSAALKKGVDAQATRLKVVEYIESLLK